MKIITTVGTSLFANYEKYNSKIGRDLEDKSYYNNEKKFKRNIDRIINTLLEYTNKENETSCAELTSIYKIKEKYPNEKFEIILIASDTLKSYIASKVIEKYLKNKNLEIKIEIIEDFQVKDYKRFKDGLVNLINKLYYTTNYYFNDVLLNITGGYKAIIPYLTIFAQINNIQIYYIFEESNELILIPQLPINVDWGLFFKYKNIIDELSNEVEVISWEQYKRENGIENDFPDIIEKIEVDNKFLISLNIMGKIFYEKFKDYYLVKIFKNSNFTRESKGNRKELEEAIVELFKKLDAFMKNNNIKNTTDSLINEIKKLSDQNDLKHGGNLDNNTFIFKSTDNGQIRIIYSPILKNSELLLKIFYYRRGQFDHKKYINEIKEEMKLLDLDDNDFIFLPIKKG